MNAEVTVSLTRGCPWYKAVYDWVSSECECDCHERPIRQLLDKLIGSTVNLLAINGSISPDFIVEQTGLGIVIGTLPISPETIVRFAISTCKITAVGQTT